jgi:isopenicillin-N epimerase
MKTAGVAAALFGVPAAEASQAAPPLPDRSLLLRDPEAYWIRLRDEQFLLPGWRAFLNNGSLGVAPRPVVQAVIEYLRNSAGLLMDEYPRWGYETLDQHRTALAAYVGCNKDEIALTHNATEALSTVAAGLDLRPGDEVLMTDQEHPSGKGPWLMRQARHGIRVREVEIPLPPKSPEQLADRVISAIGPHTRVLSFSGILSPTGTVLPVKEICRAAREKGVITLVDGAHMHGQIPVRISDLGCDFFAASPHKWMFSPAGCGFLYIREEMLDRLWPSVTTTAWEDHTLKAARFMMVGTNNRAIFEGLAAGIRFSDAIGHDSIYSRIHQLARIGLERARKYPYVELLTPDDDRMFGGLVCMQFRKDPKPLFDLCARKKVWVMGSQRFRLSTHIHTRPQDLDTFFGLMEETLGKA